MPAAFRPLPSVLAAALAAIATLAPAAPVQDGSEASPAEGASSQRVTVTATRTPVKVDDAVADITVLTREDLERATGLTLAEVLATQPGVQITANGGRGTSTGVYLRGMEARHTLLLVDGVRIDSATLGLPSFDNLPVALVDHIEIVRGPLCALYGADAAGGVVQVFTRRGRGALLGHAELAAGSHGYLAGSAGATWGTDSFDLAVDGSRVHDGGFSSTNPHNPFFSFHPDRDPFDQDAINLRGGWRPVKDWRVDALVLQSASLVHYDDGPDVDSRARLRNGVQALTVAGKVLPAWRSTLQFARSVDEYVTIASEYGGEGTISTLERRLSWENAVDTPVGTALGVLERTTQDVAKPGDPYPVTHRQIDGATLALQGSAGPHAWNASLRRDHNSQFGVQATGGAGYAFDLDPQWQLGASWGSSFVAPSFNQLYYPGGYGNPALQPERGHSAEARVRWQKGDTEVRATAYRQHVRGYITPGQDATNIDDVTIDGLTVTGEQRWAGGGASLTLETLDPRDVSNGLQLVRRARNDAKLVVDHSVGDWSAGMTWTSYAARADVVGYDASFNPQRGTLGAYSLLDLRADWRFARGWSLGARVNNATDRRYETAYGYNQPRREGYVVLAWQPK